VTQIPQIYDVAPSVSGPFALTVNTETDIAYPTNAPQVFTWAVITNSSPFTLVIKQGAQLGLLAAFTADAFPVQSAIPLAVIPFSGTGVLLAGTDTSVYVAWYKDTPPGQYPAALGAGAIPVSSSSLLASTALQPLNSGNEVSFPPTAEQPTAGFGGISVFVSEDSGLGPLTLTLTWVNGAGTQARTIIIGAGGSASFMLPHEGTLFQAVLANNTAANLTFSVVIAQSTLAVAMWNTGTSLLIPFTVGTAPGPIGTSTVIATTTATYAGPATLYVLPNDATNGDLSAQIQTASGVWAGWFQLNVGGQLPQNGILLPITLPPQPVRLVWGAGGAGTTHPVVSLTADDYRHAA